MMRTVLFKVIIPFLVTVVFLWPHTIAYGQGGVFVDRSSINQDLDFQTNQFVISGQVENALPLGVRDVIVRLYVPEPGTPETKTWDVELARIDAHTTGHFSFRVHPREIAEYETFVVWIWGYELDTRNVYEALSLAQEPDPAVLRAVTRTLARLTMSRPDIVVESFAESTGLGRLCLTEAALGNADPRAMQYLAEQLLAGQEVVDQTLFRDVSILADLVAEPPPFSQIERWQPTGDPQIDVANLVKAFPAGAVPMLVRMRFTGTDKSRKFAEDYLRALDMASAERQFTVDDSQARAALTSIYRELACLFSQDAQFRHALATAELESNGLFLLLILVAAGVVPCAFTWWTSRHSM